VKFFSGFGFQNDQEIFRKYLINSEYAVAGFSYGAQKAMEYILKTTDRVDKLILLSPAFFNGSSKSFKRTQMHYFKLDKNAYMKIFFSNVSYPSNKKIDEKYISTIKQNELNDLLDYEWKEDNIKRIVDKNIIIEVFLGEKDKIIDANAANDFFSKYATTYFIKNAGHLLNDE
jgi:pimeloyl-ACP methyl ester carboxylesterase